MAALQPLAVAMPLSARLRLALHPHAASERFLALQRKPQQKTPRGDSRGFFLVSAFSHTIAPVDFDAIVSLLQARLPRLMAVYAFGSRVTETGRHAQADSDLDLAVLVEGYADPLELFDLAGQLSDVAHCPVDLLDMRAASTVMQHQILMLGQRIWARDVRAGLFEAAMLTEKLHLDEARRGLLQDIQQRGTVYGR